MTDNKSKNNKIKQVFIASTLGGIVQGTLVTAVGYPLDLVKARLQSRMYPDTISCLKGTIETEGVKGLYRGSAMPWISHMLKRPVQYSIGEYLKSKSIGKDKTNLFYNYVIGGVSGVLSPVFGTPLQVVKVSMQTTKFTNSLSKNSWYFIKHNYERNGLKGFYRGFIPTAIKDCAFSASFIGTYYTLRDVVGTDTMYKGFFNGAAANCVTWMVFIPIDYVKTTVQRSETPLKIKDVVINSYKNYGIRVFWKGVIPACLRTIPVSGISMLGYERVREMILKL